MDTITAAQRNIKFPRFLQGRNHEDATTLWPLCAEDSPAGRRPSGVVAALYIFLFIILISSPSLLSTPTKGRESGGVVLDSKEYTKELTCLINTLYAEARSEPEEGIRAVMSVIYNRKNHKNYPNTFCKVILQDKQFSAFNSDKILATKRLKPLRELDKITYTKVAGIAQEAVVGAFKPVLEPSVLWYAHTRVKNKWTQKFKRVIVLGNHSFYKEI